MPWEGEPTAIAHRLELLSGLELDENEGLRILDAAAWRAKH